MTNSNGLTVVELCARYRRTVDAHESRKGKTDDENDRFVDDVLEPLERALAKAVPTTRAGIVALLDTALDKDYPGAPTTGARVLITNARDALAGATPGAMVPVAETASDDDPIFGMIAACQKAHAPLDAKQRRVKALRSKIPVEVRNWTGSADPAEVAEHKRITAQWYERVGMPFTPDDEDDYWQPFFSACNDAEVAAIESEPRTLAGFGAKVAYLSRLRREIEQGGFDKVHDYHEAVEKYGCLSDEAMIAAFACDGDVLFEWPELPDLDEPTTTS